MPWWTDISSIQPAWHRKLPHYALVSFDLPLLLLRGAVLGESNNNAPTYVVGNLQHYSVTLAERLRRCCESAWTQHLKWTRHYIGLCYFYWRPDDDNSERSLTYYCSFALTQQPLQAAQPFVQIHHGHQSRRGHASCTKVPPQAITRRIHWHYRRSCCCIVQKWRHGQIPVSSMGRHGTHLPNHHQLDKLAFLIY